MKKGKFIIHDTEDQGIKIEVEIQNYNVWVTLKQLSELFQCNETIISDHIKNIYQDNELNPEITTIVDEEGSGVTHYNLEMIISVGYRAKSHRGTQFRKWAGAKMSEFQIKGFTLDDARLSKQYHGQTQENSQTVS